MQPWIYTFVMLASYAMILIRSFSMVVFIIFGPSPFWFALAILLSPLKPFSALWIVDIVAAAASRFSTRLLCNWFRTIAINCPLTVFISDKMYACCCNCSYNFVSSMNFGYFGDKIYFMYIVTMVISKKKKTPHQRSKAYQIFGCRKVKVNSFWVSLTSGTK